MASAYADLATSSAGGVFAVVLGLLWGSFANVCIYRWAPSDEFPDGRSVVRPGSRCGGCQTPIRWFDNIPILSYVWLRGRCRACGVTFSPRYLFVEALTGALFGVAWWFTLGTGGMLFGSFELQLFRFAIAALFVLDMVVIAFIDLDTKLILHRTTIPMMIVFYAATFALPERQWWDGLLGIAVGYGVPWLIGVVYKLVRGQEGMGLGDGTMLALVGSLLGWRGVVFSLFAGSVVGSIIGVAPLLVGRKRSTSDDAPSLMKTELPFGPYLAIGAVFYLFAEPWIVLHFRLLGT